MEAKRKKIDPHITWAGDFCKHCFTCINICPVDNLIFKGDDMISLGKCIHCQLCEKYCPDFAIEAEPKAKTKETAAKPGKKSSGQNKAGETK
jgi:NAD-dependent dihydropyrimidine dehydrogenase PreA subunit